MTGIVCLMTGFYKRPECTWVTFQPGKVGVPPPLLYMKKQVQRDPENCQAYLWREQRGWCAPICQPSPFPLLLS